MSLNHIDKYLQRYAESECKYLNSFPENAEYKHVVVIPAYKENPSFIHSFIDSTLSSQQALIIIVINQPDSDNDITPQLSLYHDILSLIDINWQNGPLTFGTINNCNSALLVVDRFRQPLNPKKGVGQARKIAADLATTLINNKVIASPWIFSTDADVTLPDDYFSALSSTTLAADVVAVCYKFSHFCENKIINHANSLYQQALQYYVDGLEFAQSPYSFYTIGSIIAFDVTAYVKVRGFPKRSAGEDFYLLNKLAKQGRIINDFASPLIITARTSDRVPFGTGPAVSDIIDLLEQNKPYCYYHPEVFILLKQCLNAFKLLWQYRENHHKWYQHLSNEIKHALDELHFGDFLQQHLPTTNLAKQKAQQLEVQFYKQLTVWFDAFKTLKFIHSLRRAYYPDIPLEKALAQFYS